MARFEKVARRNNRHTNVCLLQLDQKQRAALTIKTRLSCENVSRYVALDPYSCTVSTGCDHNYQII